MKLNIGLFGCGIVGTGVYNIITKRQHLRENIKISKICVRDAQRLRPDFHLNEKESKITTNYDDILNDPSINCIVELIGGITDAKTIVFTAIKKGKHVITANKALVATYMDEINHLLVENPNVQFGFEASVCGGIPIINTLQESYAGDHISKILGIMNGTTNFILSKMETIENLQFSTVLKEAQELGYAEANPSADIDGYDVQAKIAILAKLAFNKTIQPKNIPTRGISSIQAIDFAYAKMMRSTIKLLGVAYTTTSDNNNEKELVIYVSPVIIPLTNVISKITGATNIVQIRSENLVTSEYVGQGAGRYPTANSVVSDIIQISQNKLKKIQSMDICNNNIEKMRLATDYTSCFYIRVTISDQVGVIHTIGKLAEEKKVSIYSILQVPIIDVHHVDFVVTTDKTKLSNIVAMCDTIAKQNFVKCKPLFMPIFHE